MGIRACGTHIVATGHMLNVQVVINAQKLAIDPLWFCNRLSIGLLFFGKFQYQLDGTAAVKLLWAVWSCTCVHTQRLCALL